MYRHKTYHHKTYYHKTYHHKTYQIKTYPTKKLFKTKQNLYLDLLLLQNHVCLERGRKTESVFSLENMRICWSISMI